MTKEKRKARLGQVVSANMQKTAVVAVELTRRHPRYHRVVRRVTKFKVHDENGVAKTGDTVRMEEPRPLSREKRWRLVEVVTRRNVAEVKPTEIA